MTIISTASIDAVPRSRRSSLAYRQSGRAARCRAWKVPDRAVLATVCFQAVFDGLNIVKNRCCGIERDGAVRDDPERMPARFVLVVHHEHGVGKDGTEREIVPFELLLGERVLWTVTS
jgi:hypothetical protein